MRKLLCHAFLIALLALVVHVQPASAQTPVPVVQAVLFFSPTCSHCQYVLTEVLPPIFEQYGEQLQLFPVDVTQPEGRVLFLDAVDKLHAERPSVPFLVIGDRVLIGSVEIPEQFPGLIDTYLAMGGIGWPDLPGLAEFIASAQSTQAALLVPSPEPTATLPVLASPTTSTTTGNTITPDALPTVAPVIALPDPEGSMTLGDRLMLDPLGNGLAVLILAGMLFAVGWGGWFFWHTPGRKLAGLSLWSILVLCILGLSVAGYLTYVETLQVEAYCGLVGDCNTVQQSEYSRLFGVIPLGMLGLVGYIAILAAWVIQKFSSGKWADSGALAMLVLTVFGTFFSIYLTFLEPFVIGATCAWCLTSAVISTLLMLLSIPAGKLSFNRLVMKKE